MAALTDLQGIANSIATDETNLAAAIAAVQTAISGLANGSVSPADVEAAVAQLTTAHTAFQANVTALNGIAANP